MEQGKSFGVFRDMYLLYLQKFEKLTDAERQCYIKFWQFALEPASFTLFESPNVLSKDEIDIISRCNNCEKWGAGLSDKVGQCGQIGEETAWNCHCEQWIGKE